MSEDLKSDRQRGVAAVEFAIVLPLLIFLFLGITEFGIAYYNKQVLTNASREGARAGIVDGTEVSDIETIVINYANGRLITFGEPIDPVLDPPPEFFDEYLKVNVRYEYSYLVLSTINWFGADFGTKLNIGASTTMRME